MDTPFFGERAGKGGAGKSLRIHVVLMIYPTKDVVRDQSPSRPERSFLWLLPACLSF